jgi:serine/threonine protein kinase
MTAELWARLRHLFSTAKDIRDPSARDAYLRAACPGDRKMRAEVEALVRQHEKKTPFLSVPTSLPSRMLLHYEILEQIGQGAVGVMYEARDTRLNRLVAIKVLHPWLVASPRAKTRLQNEARCASALTHPHIVTIYDLACDNGVDFIVMEYVAGKTLAQMISTGPMELRQALVNACQIAQALAKAHEAGVIHGDIKPANIMITSDGQAKLLDFGLSRVIPRTGGTALPDGNAAIGGTRLYMAPEQARRAPDQRSDVFSFGRVLYEMLSGKPLSQEAHGPRSRSSAKATRRTRLRLPQAVPPVLRKLIARCLEKNPERRWQNGRDLIRELSRVAVHIAEDTRPRNAPIASRNRPRLAASAGVAALATVGAVITALKVSPSTNLEVRGVSVPASLAPVAMSGVDQAANAYDRAVVQMNLQSYDEAKVLFGEVLRANPGHTQALYNRAVCLQNLRRFEEAIADFSLVIRRNTKDASALYHRAMCYMNLEQLNPALADLTATIDIHPTYMAYINRAKVRASLGDSVGANDDERRAEQAAKTQ